MRARPRSVPMFGRVHGAGGVHAILLFFQLCVWEASQGSLPWSFNTAGRKLLHVSPVSLSIRVFLPSKAGHGSER